MSTRLTAGPAPEDLRERRDWHAREPRVVLTELEVDRDLGVGSEEVAARLERHGPNELRAAPRRPAWLVFLDQFRNLLIVVLIGAAVLAGVVGEAKDAVVIGVVLLFNAVLGYVQEARAERSLAALKRMLVATAKVRRDGQVRQVPAQELVPGDLVLLDAGDRVPADGQLVHGTSLEIDESALTGESAPVAKAPGAVAADTPLAERAGTVHMNSVVTRGRAELLVTATGMATEMGKLAGMLESAGGGTTPLQAQLHVLGKRLAIVAAGAVAAFFVLGLLRGQPLGETALSSVALAVAAIPEGLPAVVTVTLAVGVHHMAKRGAIVKRLASVETLGSTTVICSDKTGTLTLNQMTARVVAVGGRRLDVTGSGYSTEGRISRPDADQQLDALLQRVLVAAALCNDSSLEGDRLAGDPTEGALLALARKDGIDLGELRSAMPRIAEAPFDSARKYMATVHDAPEGTIVFVKGGLDVLLDRCSTIARLDGPSPLDDRTHAELLATMEVLAGEGLRVLAVAERGLDHRPAGADEAAVLGQVDDLVLLGVVGLLDPPRTEARDAIALCRRAGVQVKMITGDHATTAASIARSLGIEGSTLTGADLDRLDDQALAEVVESTGVFARVAPEHKVRLVGALQARGHVTAMTGDGVNDAPALKTADIGVAMGITGTEVSKEAAAMVLTDDNFATIVRAVEAGRSIYDNIGKFVRFQLSTNLGAIISLLGAQILGLPVPFTAVQVLWVNLIMDGPPAMALGVDPPEPGAMDRPPRSAGERILTAQRLLRLLGTGLVMATGTLGILVFGRETGTEAHALSLAFTTFVLFQVFNVFNVRNERRSALHLDSFRNHKLLGALAVVVLLQVLAVHVGPVQELFGTVEFTLADWGLTIAVASSVLWFEELRKVLRRRSAAGAPAATVPVTTPH
jgi:P-type Ca2+ transporter type 2C